MNCVIEKGLSDLRLTDNCYALIDDLEHARGIANRGQRGSSMEGKE